MTRYDRDRIQVGRSPRWSAGEAATRMDGQGSPRARCLWCATCSRRRRTERRNGGTGGSSLRLSEDVVGADPSPDHVRLTGYLLGAVLPGRPAIGCPRSSPRCPGWLETRRTRSPGRKPRAAFRSQPFCVTASRTAALLGREPGVVRANVGFRLVSGAHDSADGSLAPAQGRREIPRRFGRSGHVLQRYQHRFFVSQLATRRSSTIR